MAVSRRILFGTSAAAIASLALFGCASAEPPASPAPSESSAAAPTETSRQVPAACASLDLAAGATLDGAALGDCVAQALSSYGSGRIQVTADSTGDIDFTYDPEYSFAGEFDSAAGPVAITYTGGEMWIDLGEGPVKGDLQSADPQEQLMGLAGELYRFYSDLEQTAQLVAAQPSWTVADATEPIALPSGETVESFRIVSAGAFTWNEIPVSEFVLWFGDGWVPTATQATVAMMGITGTQGQLFYDLGAPIEITPLG